MLPARSPCRYTSGLCQPDAPQDCVWTAQLGQGCIAVLRLERRPLAALCTQPWLSIKGGHQADLRAQPTEWTVRCGSVALTVVELHVTGAESNCRCYWSLAPLLGGAASASELLSQSAQRVALRRWATCTNNLRYTFMGFSADAVRGNTLARQNSCGASHGVACTLVFTTLLIVVLASPASRGRRISAAINVAKDFFHHFARSP